MSRSNLSTAVPLLLAAGAGGLAWRQFQRMREASLRGCSAIVTGGSRGLGLLMARELAREGCRVTICARDLEELETARFDLQARGAEIHSVVCDVSDRAQVDHLIDAASERFGRVDVLVNNAGIISVGPFEAASRDDFEQAMDVMFWGMVNPTLAALPQMLRRGSGRIVNITSIGGVISVPHLLPYNCAKFAAVGFSQGLTAELASQGIQVTTVIPGMMRIGSHLNARFRGKSEREYAWFSLGASLPGMSVKGERAARKIVAALKRGDAVKIVGFPAQLAARLHGLFPGAGVRLLSLVDRLLPAAPEGGNFSGSESGHDARRRLNSPWLNRITSLGQAAAEQNNEV